MNEQLNEALTALSAAVKAAVAGVEGSYRVAMQPKTASAYRVGPMNWSFCITGDFADVLNPRDLIACAGTAVFRASRTWYASASNANPKTTSVDTTVLMSGVTAVDTTGKSFTLRSNAALSGDPPKPSGSYGTYYDPIVYSLVQFSPISLVRYVGLL